MVYVPPGEWVVIDIDTAARCGTPATWWNKSFPPCVRQGEQESVPWIAAFDLHQASLLLLEALGWAPLRLHAGDITRIAGIVAGCGSARAALADPFLR